MRHLCCLRARGSYYYFTPARYDAGQNDHARKGCAVRA